MLVNLFLKIIFFFRFAAPKYYGAIAQMVEHWTENPGVPGSIPGGTTRPSLFRGDLVVRTERRSDFFSIRNQPKSLVQNVIVNDRNLTGLVLLIFYFYITFYKLTKKLKL